MLKVWVEKLLKQMSSSEPVIYCPNLACANPDNALGNRCCEACQTPLIYRYLWALGSAAGQMPIAELIGDRYQVIAPQIWLDTRPAQPPIFPQELPEEILPYLRLYPHRLHIPEVYGFCLLDERYNNSDILLLENVPVDPSTGNLYPAMLDAWATATPVRQVYWLWQILELWTPLAELGLTSSLLKAENIRVQGWRVWLKELYRDAGLITKPDLQDLGYHWLTWTGKVAGPAGDRLQEIGKRMRRPDVDVQAIAPPLNQLLLELAGQLPLRVRVFGATDPGPSRPHNEDACYPTEGDLPKTGGKQNNPLMGHLAMVCDGVGGHEGGEVASQLAVQALKLPVQALMAELAAQQALTTPGLVMEQLEAIVRVVNNMIADLNDSQGRSSRQRMGTTLVMAFQLPQKVKTLAGSELANSHELYLVHVGDSRAYWITGNYCQRLTLDDDVASREVRLGHSLYREAANRRDAGALTQALGTREGELLRPNIQRFIIEEDGLLLLCSDGLSDNDWVEQSWLDYAPAVLNDELALEEAVKEWIKLANQKNGHDNTSVVLSYFRLSPEKLVLFDPAQLPSSSILDEEELTEASKNLLYDESVEAATARRRGDRRRRQGWETALGLLTVLAVSAAVGFVAWWQLDPQGFDQQRQRIFQQR